MIPGKTQSPAGGGILVIMAKAARPGAVKTRLSACLPSPAITGLYRCLLDDTLALARSLDNVETAIMTPAGDVEDLSRAIGDGVQVVAQAGEGLGAGQGDPEEAVTATLRSRSPRGSA